MKKQRWEESEEKSRREKIRESEKKEDAGAQKCSKVVKHCVFPMVCGSGGSISRLAKAAGAEPAGQMTDEKLHAVVARSTFPSQNVQNTPFSDHFWKLRCRKSARRCGAKHISKSKCTKHLSSGALLEVEISKKCAPLWREAHFKVKSVKAHSLRALLEVDMSKKCTPLWCEAHFQVKMLKTPHVRITFGRSDVVSCGRGRGLCTLTNANKTCKFCRSFNHNHHYTPLHYIALHYNYNYHYYNYNYVTLRYASYITLHYTALN